MSFLEVSRGLQLSSPKDKNSTVGVVYAPLPTLSPLASGGRLVVGSEGNVSSDNDM